MAVAPSANTLIYQYPRWQLNSNISCNPGYTLIGMSWNDTEVFNCQKDKAVADPLYNILNNIPDTPANNETPEPAKTGCSSCTKRRLLVFALIALYLIFR